VTFWYGSGSLPLTNGSESGSRYFFSSLTFKTPTKNYFFLQISLFYYLLKVHLHHLSKIKSNKEVTVRYSRNQGFSYYFCLMTEGFGSGSVPLTNRSGSRGPQNIQITKNYLTCRNWTTELAWTGGPWVSSCTRWWRASRHSRLTTRTTSSSPSSTTMSSIRCGWAR
jgi:hypothetical protein